jgi:hypothetical protein
MTAVANAAIVLGPLLIFGGALWRLGPSPDEDPGEQVDNLLWRLGRPMMIAGAILTAVGAVGLLT